MQYSDYYPKNALRTQNLISAQSAVNSDPNNTTAVKKTVSSYLNMRICMLVSKHYKIDYHYLLSAHRHPAPIARARQVAMYLCHTLLAQSYSQIGFFFNRDRTTVAHACSRIEDLRDGTLFDSEINRLESSIRSEVLK